jgi:hypothetical protein
MKKHPLHIPNEVIFETPMMRKFYDQIMTWLWIGMPGAFAHGDPRIGKSTYCLIADGKIKNRFGQAIKVVRVTIHKRDELTIEAIFKAICSELDLMVPPRSPAESMSKLIFNYFKEHARENSTKQMVLIVDEMQKMALSQIEVFAELHSRLIDAKLNIFILFIGNTEPSRELINKLKEKASVRHLRKRFFSQETVLFGIREKDELESILCCFDDSEYPKGSKISYTEFFVGEKLGKKWKFSCLAALIWEMYESDCKPNTKSASWPLENCMAMLRLLLVDFLTENGTCNIEEDIRSCFAGSGSLNLD